MAWLRYFTSPGSKLLRMCSKVLIRWLPIWVLIQMTDFLPMTNAKNSSETSEESIEECHQYASLCKNGILIPMWTPQENISAGTKAGRAIFYLVCLFYMFLGTSIVADRFMASIEVITSKKREVVVKRADGGTHVVYVRIWNETVSNLTLMALGSSAPEILLSVIEICGNTFKAGELGPSTIVGSAAFNLFVIIAICIYCIPDDEVRRINHHNVFLVTAAWSIWAYVWLVIIVAVSSKGVVEIWEAVLTLFFFPATVFTAYLAEQKVHDVPRIHTVGSKRQSIAAGASKTQSRITSPRLKGKSSPNITEDVINKGLESKDPQVIEFEEHRQMLIDIMRNLRQEIPNIDVDTLERMAENEFINQGSKSRAFYRVKATKKLLGPKKGITKDKTKHRESINSQLSTNVLSATTVSTPADIGENNSEITSVYFDPGHYTVLENVGLFYVTVKRTGGDMSQTCYVNYNTGDGTAHAGRNYLASMGTLGFKPNEDQKKIYLTIINNDVFEIDEHFYVQLSNPRFNNREDASGISDSNQIELAIPYMATVMILDDDHPGIFYFLDKELTVTENMGEVMITVARDFGVRGRVKVPYHAVDGSAKVGKDYDILSGEIVFENGDSEKLIKVPIIDHEEYEKSVSFSLVLDTPEVIGKLPVRNRKLSKVEEMGQPRLGSSRVITINVKETQEFKSTVDKLMAKSVASVAPLFGTASWLEQFSEAFTVDEKLPLTLFWNLVCAFIPPTDYVGGWACFVGSIAMIGLVTAVINDLASSFGCTIGLKDSVTAISIVALGTSMPDTFASKIAAINEPDADSSVGNVTGSNGVNVFLGIGIAWTLAAVYHHINGVPFVVPPGELAMSVTIFCALALCAICLLMFRRRPSIGGELGGPPLPKKVSSIVMVIFWFIYIVISSLNAYCYIPGF